MIALLALAGCSPLWISPDLRDSLTAPVDAETDAHDSAVPDSDSDVGGDSDTDGPIDTDVEVDTDTDVPHGPRHFDETRSYRCDAIQPTEPSFQTTAIQMHLQGDSLVDIPAECVGCVVVYLLEVTDAPVLCDDVEIPLAPVEVGLVPGARDTYRMLFRAAGGEDSAFDDVGTLTIQTAPAFASEIDGSASTAGPYVWTSVGTVEL